MLRPSEPRAEATGFVGSARVQGASASELLASPRAGLDVPQRPHPTADPTGEGLRWRRAASWITVGRVNLGTYWGAYR